MSQQFKRIFLGLILLSSLLVINAQNWQLLGLDEHTILSITMHPEHPDTIYAGGTGSSLSTLFISPNGGLTWDTLYANRMVWNIAIHPENPQIMYIADNLIEKTTDGGQNWFPADSGIIIIEALVSSLAIDPKFPDTLYSGSVGFFGGEFYQTTNGGHYWECISDTIAQLHESITKIAINPLNTQIVFVGTGGSGDVMRTTDGGLTWIPTGLQLDAVYDLEIDSRNPDIVYAGGTTGGFYKSEDGGITWMEYNDGLPSSLTIRAIEIDHTANKLFLASKDSVYQSQMTPIYWNEINNGLPAHSLIIRSMKLDSITSTLYLGTNHGIYAYDVLTNLDDKAFEQLERFVLYQNYPNPFNPETVIRYQLPVASDVELSVYNILGQKVRTLVKGRQSAGRHEVTWDGRDDGGVKVSSGVYVYQLKIGKTVLSRKMLVLR